MFESLNNELQRLIESAANIIRQHPLSRNAYKYGAWEGAQRLRYALFQVATAALWPGFLSAAMGAVKNPVLKEALRSNASCEVGATQGSTGHVTMARRFCRSLGISNEQMGVWSMNQMNQRSVSNMNSILDKPDEVIAGWMLGNEALAGVMFEAFLPAFRLLMGCDTSYMLAHIEVDTNEHAREVMEAITDIMNKGGNSEKVLSGLYLAIQARLDYLKYIETGAC